MEGINRVPAEMLKLIPLFDGDSRQLPLFIKKCKYILRMYSSNIEGQAQYLFHVITSRLTGKQLI